MSLVFDASNTYCISVLSNATRWARMEARFAALGLEVTRFQATTPEDVSGNFVHYLKTGQQCCAQSHVRLWEHILASGVEYALVLEDDAQFDFQWRDKLAELAPTLEADPEWHAIFLNAADPVEPHFTWTAAKNQYLTGGYVISRRGVIDVLAMFSRGSLERAGIATDGLPVYADCMYTSDWMTWILQSRNHSYTYFPWIIVQDGVESTIGSNVADDHAKVVRALNDANYPIEEHYTP